MDPHPTWLCPYESGNEDTWIDGGKWCEEDRERAATDTRSARGHQKVQRAVV